MPPSKKHTIVYLFWISTNFLLLLNGQLILTDGAVRQKKKKVGKHRYYKMATWWRCCVNYSCVRVLVDMQCRISGEQEKQFNDQLSKMNNFPVLCECERLQTETDADPFWNAFRQGFSGHDAKQPRAVKVRGRFLRSSSTQFHAR